MTDVYQDGTLAFGFTSRSPIFVGIDPAKVSTVTAADAIPSYRHLFTVAA